MANYGHAETRLAGDGKVLGWIWSAVMLTRSKKNGKGSMSHLLGSRALPNHGKSQGDTVLNPPYCLY